MLKHALFCSTLVVLLSGCATAKVDGNQVNYANGMSFIINETYSLIGKAPYSKPIASYDFNTPSTGTSVVHIFAKTSGQNKDVSEFIGAYSFLLPSRWYMRHPGLVPARSFEMDLKDSPGVANLLKDSGVQTASKFLCGEFYLYTYTSGQQSIFYCSAETVIPPSVDHLSFLKSKFSESVHVVSNGDQSTVTTSPPSQTSSEVSPTKVAVLDKGKHVVIAYSKIGNAEFIGRSDNSTEDALNKAVASCNYSDCKKVWVSHADGCVAFAKSSSGSWGKARGADVTEAKAKALKICNAYTKDDNCEVAATLCPEY